MGKAGPHISKDASTLRRQLRRLLYDPHPAPGRQRLQKVLRQLISRSDGWDIFLFGGMPRDIAISGPFSLPRDVDIVVGDASTDDIGEVFSDFVQRRNRFGGFSLYIDDWHIDIWPLERTWAFLYHWASEASIADLPKTTFLNVEAIAVELKTVPGRPRHIYEHGFFEAVNNRVVEINFEENPYPDFCIIRSLLVATKLRFSLGWRLVRYIDYHAQQYDVGELVDIQRKHYGSVRADEGRLALWLSEIRRHAIRRRRDPLRLFIYGGYGQYELWEHVQLGLWDRTKPSFETRPDAWTY